MIEEDYVSFGIAKLLKEKGYPEFTYERYGLYVNGVFHKLNSNQGMLLHPGEDTVYEVPTHQMVLKWLREVHGVDIIIHPFQEEYPVKYDGVCYKNDIFHDTLNYYEDYSLAVESAIEYTLKNLIS